MRKFKIWRDWAHSPFTVQQRYCNMRYCNMQRIRQHDMGFELNADVVDASCRG